MEAVELTTLLLEPDDLEGGITPLIRVEIKKETKFYLSNKEIKEVRKRFNDFIDTITVIPVPDNTSAKLEEFKGILDDRTIEKMEAYYKQEEKNLQNVMALLLPPSFLNRSSLQEVLVRMLKDITKYREFLKLFIDRFNAHKERIEGKHILKKDTVLRPKFQNDPRTIRELDTPLHCAVRQLNEDFIEWLLEQPETEVNLRNKRRETALAILCQMYDWSKEIAPKVNSRLEEIEKVLENENDTKKIGLDGEKIELIALEKQLKEKMNAPTILKLIKRLLEKGADFNIYMNDGTLPFDFLRKYETDADVAEIINVDVKSNVAMTVKAQKQLNARAEDKNEPKKRIVKFYKKTEDMDVRVTVELLEIFICFEDLEKFKHYWKDFNVTSDNVKKIITLLLHVAVERNYTTYVIHIIEKASEEIFKLEEKKATQRNTQEENQMVHRTELKGLLKMACRNGNITLLNMFLKMMNDRLLVNENPLLINTLNEAYTMKQKKKSFLLLECVKLLINNRRKVDMYRVDRNGNTALHLALSYGYDKIASLLLQKVHGLLRIRNHQNKTPIEYGTTEFWNSYLDSCIGTNNDESELRFNVGFLKPRVTDESSDTSKCFPPQSLTRFVNDMTALRLISQSKDRKEFLMHPVIIAFITMKWKRLSHWHILNLLLTTFTMGTFITYTLMPCPSGGWKYGVMAFIGACLILVREVMQWFLLGWSYVTLDNALGIMNVELVAMVLRCGCDRDGWCKYVPIGSSLLFVSWALQATFLLGASWNNLFITFYMFKTVSGSFFYSFLSFSPVIVAFACSFYQVYNEPSSILIRNGTESSSSAENFNNFPSFFIATIKTLVMMTGEFEAANIDFNGGKWMLFVAFLFIAPMIILNLINGLAVSDITDIRKESEFISVYKKVKMLELYERAIIESRFTLPGCLQWLFHDPLLPSPFFENYESIIYVNVNEKNKLAIKNKKKNNSIPGLPLLPSRCLKLYIGIFQLVLYMSLDQLYVDKAKTIVRRQSKNNLGLGMSKLVDTEQTDRPALVNKTAMNQQKTLSSSTSGPSGAPDSRDKQTEMLQEQVRSMIAMLNDMQKQLAGKHVTKAEPTAGTSKISK